MHERWVFHFHSIAELYIADINLYLWSVTALDQDRNTLLQTFGIKSNVKLCKVLQIANVLQYSFQLNKLPERLEVMYRNSGISIVLDNML